MNMLIKKGAEASLFLKEYIGRKVVLKTRLPKKYRLPELDRNIQSKRTKQEPQIMHRAKEAGIPTPIIFLIDLATSTIVMEYIEGKTVKEILNDLPRKDRVILCNYIGTLIGKLHKNGIIHGDLTTSNMILNSTGQIVFIDFGLGEQTPDLETRGVDLHLMKRTLTSSHHKCMKKCFKSIIQGYEKIMGVKKTEEVLKKIKEIEKRGRYVSIRK
jgi:TP53 regulating kinase-like protein